jgi:general stress protein YciG
MATSKRGFASMDPSKQKEIASKGGRAAHAKGTAHEFTSDEARVAGRKGGEAVSRDRAHMAAIGREGGHSRGARARAAAGTAAAVGAAVGIAAGVAGATIAQRHHSNENSGMDVSQGNGSQQFVRQPNEERGGYEGSSVNRAERNASSREDRNDSSSDSGPLSNRDRI